MIFEASCLSGPIWPNWCIPSPLILLSPSPPLLCLHLLCAPLLLLSSRAPLLVLHPQRPTVPSSTHASPAAVAFPSSTPSHLTTPLLVRTLEATTSAASPPLPLLLCALGATMTASPPLYLLMDLATEVPVTPQFFPKIYECLDFILSWKAYFFLSFLFLAQKPSPFSRFCLASPARLLFSFLLPLTPGPATLAHSTSPSSPPSLLSFPCPAPKPPMPCTSATPAVATLPHLLFCGLRHPSHAALHAIPRPITGHSPLPPSAPPPVHLTASAVRCHLALAIPRATSLPSTSGSTASPSTSSLSFLSQHNTLDEPRVTAVPYLPCAKPPTSPLNLSPTLPSHQSASPTPLSPSQHHRAPSQCTKSIPIVP